MRTKAFKQGIHMMLAVMVGAAMLLGSGQASAVEKDANNMPVSAEIVVKHEIKGDYSKVGGDTYVLTAASEESPMPKGSSGKVKKISFEGKKTESFGEITYMKPDVYEYTVTRVKNDVKNVKKDYKVYDVKVVATNNNEAIVIINGKGDSQKGEILYEDMVVQGEESETEPTTTPPPTDNDNGNSGNPSGSRDKGNMSNSHTKTGDMFNPIVIGMVFLASLSLMLFLFAKRRQKRYEESN